MATPSFIYIVESGAAEESWVEAVFARAEDAIAHCRELAAKRSEEKRSFYKDKKVAKQWEIVQKKTVDYEILLRVGYYCVHAKAWPVR